MDYGVCVGYSSGSQPVGRDSLVAGQMALSQESSKTINIHKSSKITDMK